MLAVGDVPARGPQRPRRRIVAIKKLRPDAARRLGADALLQEFELLDQVKHRGIVRVFEYLPQETAVVMEYVHGSSLRTVLEKLKERKAQVFTQAAVEIGCELADALYQAHTTPGDNGEPLQLVHRDLKPDNVILTPQGDVRLLDWGLARVDNADFVAERPDRLRGTPLYMAPEQAVGHAVDHRTDLFSLGLILSELLLGKAVYAPRDDVLDPYADALERIRTGRTQHACSDLERMLPEVGPVLAKCLATRPSDRYADGQALLVQLRRSLYRDRGAYLKEFAEYYFSEVEPLGPAPTLDSLGKRGQRTRMSIEERLRRSMNEPAEPAPTPAVLAAPGRSAAPQRPAPPPLPPQQTSPGADMSSSSGSGRGGPPVPPVGGKASRATPFSPPAGGGGRRPVGQRRPDETGMLEMVPLSSDPDEAAAAADPSATAFFAIPAPKSGPSSPAASGPPAFGAPPPPAATPGVPPPPGAAFGAPPPPPAGAFGAPPPPPPGAYGAPAAPAAAAFAPSGPPPQIPAGPPPASRYPSPPPGGGYAAPAYGGAPGGPQPPPPAIQGPVASYGATTTPFQVQGPSPGATGAGKEAARTQSQRVYALVLGVLVLVFTAVVGALWLRSGTDGGLDGSLAGRDGRGAGASAGVAPPTPPDRAPKVVASAESDEPEEPDPLPPRNNTRRQVTPPSPKAASRPPSTPRPSAGSLSITLQGEAGGITAVEIKCPSHRDRRSLSGSRASFSGVPNEACTLFFRGASIAKFSPVSGGQSLTCSILGTQANCR